MLQPLWLLILSSLAVSSNGELSETTRLEEVLSELLSLSVIEEGLSDKFCESDSEDIFDN